MAKVIGLMPGKAQPTKGESEQSKSVGTMLMRRRTTWRRRKQIIIEFKTDEEAETALFLVDGLPIMRFEE